MQGKRNSPYRAQRGACVRRTISALILSGLFASAIAVLGSQRAAQAAAIPATVTVTGYVEDADGDRMGGVTVTAYTEEGGEIVPGPSTTSAEGTGTYTLTLETFTNYGIQASMPTADPPLADSLRYLFTLSADSGTEVLRHTMRLANVRGVLKDGAGNATSHAAVYFLPTGGLPGTLTPNRRGRQSMEPNVMAASDYTVVLPRADGTFATHAEAGIYRIGAHPPAGSADVDANETLFEINEISGVLSQQTDLVVALRAPNVKGVVSLPDGTTPVKDSFVIIEGRDQPELDTDGNVISAGNTEVWNYSYTDSNGRYRFRVDKPGRYRLTASPAKPGLAFGAERRIDIVVEDGLGLVETPINLLPVTLSGDVLLSDGTPISGALLTFKPKLPEDSDAFFIQGVYADGQGRYFTALDPGDYTVSVFAEGVSPYDGSNTAVDWTLPPATADKDVTMPLPVVRGRVLDDKGQAMSGADVYLFDENGWLQQSGGYTDQQGRYGFDLTRGQTYRLVAVPPIELSSRFSSLGKNATIPQSGAVDVDFDLPLLSRPTYTVDRLDPAGAGNACDEVQQDPQSWDSLKRDDSVFAISNDGKRLLALVCDPSDFELYMRVIDLETGAPVFEGFPAYDSLQAFAMSGDGKVVAWTSVDNDSGMMTITLQQIDAPSPSAPLPEPTTITVPQAGYRRILLSGDGSRVLFRTYDSDSKSVLVLCEPATDGVDCVDAPTLEVGFNEDAVTKAALSDDGGTVAFPVSMLYTTNGAFAEPGDMVTDRVSIFDLNNGSLVPSVSFPAKLSMPAFDEAGDTIAFVGPNGSQIHVAHRKAPAAGPGWNEPVVIEPIPSERHMPPLDDVYSDVLLSDDGATMGFRVRLNDLARQWSLDGEVRLFGEQWWLAPADETAALNAQLVSRVVPDGLPFDGPSGSDGEVQSPVMSGDAKTFAFEGPVSGVPAGDVPGYLSPWRIFVGRFGSPASYEFPNDAAITAKAGSTSLSLSWPAADGDDVEYRWSVNPGLPSTESTDTTRSRSAVVGGLTPSTKYTVTVEALTPKGAVADTLTATVTTSATRSTTLTATVSAGGKVALVWDADGSADSYEIVATALSGATSPVDPYTSVTASKTISGLPAGSVWSFVVKSVVGTTKSVITDSASATIPTLTLTSTSWTVPMIRGLADVTKSLSITVVGEAGRVAEAIVSREAATLAPTEQVIALTETPADSGVYVGSYAVAGSQRIESVTGRIKDGAGHSATKVAVRAAVEIEGALTVRLTGSPAAGSAIALSSSNGETWASASIFEDGPQDITLHGLRTISGNRLVLYGPEGEQLVELSGIDIRQGRLTSVDLAAPVVVVATVRVTDQNGTPLAGRTVSTRINGALSWVWTAEDGTASLGSVPVGQEVQVQYDPQSLLESAASSSATVTGPGAFTISLVIPQLPTFSISGNVTNNAGNPVQGATVYVDQIDEATGRSLPLNGTTDSTGRYQVDGLVGGLPGSVRIIPRFGPAYEGEFAAVSASLTRDVVIDAWDEYLLPIHLWLPQSTAPLTLDFRTVSAFAMSGDITGRSLDLWSNVLDVPEGMQGGLLRVSGRPGETVLVCFDGRLQGEGKGCGTAVIPESKPVSGYLDPLEVNLPAAVTVTARLVTRAGTEYYGRAMVTVETATGEVVEGGGLVYGPWLRLRVRATGGLRLRIAGDWYSTGVNTEEFLVNPGSSGTIALGDIVPGGGGRFTSTRNTLVADQSTAPVGGLVGFRAQWENGGNTIENAVIRFSIPPGTTLVDNSVMLGATVVTPSVEGSPSGTRTATVPIGQLSNDGGSGSLRYQLRVNDDAAMAGFRTGAEIGSGTDFDALPSVVVSVLNLTMLAPASIATRSVLVRGRAQAGATVEVVYSGAVVGRAVASSIGTWRMALNLPERPAGTIYSMYARSSVNSDTKLSSVVAVRFDPNQVGATDVCLQNGYNRTCFDPRTGVAAFPLVFAPYAPFEVQVFVNAPDRVDSLKVWVGDDSAVAVLKSVPVPGEARDSATTRLAWVADFGVGIRKGAIRLEMSARPIRSTAPAKPATVAEVSPYVLIPPDDLEIGAPANIQQSSTELSFTQRISRKTSSGNLPMDVSVSIRTTAAPTDAEQAAMEHDGREFWDAEIGEPVTEVVNGQTVRRRTVRFKMASDVLPPGADVRYASAAPVRVRGGEVVARKGFEVAYNVVTNGDAVYSAATSGGKYQDVGDAMSGICGSGPQVNDLIDQGDDILDQAMVLDTLNGALAIASVFVAPATFGLGTLALWGLGWGLGKLSDHAVKQRTKKYQEDIAASNAVACPTGGTLPQNGVGSGSTVANPVWIYDPSGYTYEGARELRLSGVTATLLTATPHLDGTCSEDLAWVVADMAPYEQVNPLVTNAEGRYGWDVPEGCWRVQFTKTGYQTAYSAALKVLPPHLDVDVSMTKLGKPTVASVRREDSGSYIVTFDRAMDVLLTLEQLTLEKRTDSSGVTAMITAANGGEDSSGRKLATEFRVTPMVALEPGVGYRIRVKRDVEDLAGRNMETTTTVDVANRAAAPTSVAATAGVGSALVSWQAPADGGSSITGYTVRASGEGGQTCTTSGALSCTVSGLSKGVSYSFAVTATNGAGDSVASVGSNVVTVPTEAAAPSGVAVWPTEKAAYVEWAVPSDGGSSITGFTARAWSAASGGESPVGSCTGSGASATSCTITGLKNGTSYYIDVVAENAVGVSTASAPRVLVKPKKALVPVRPVVSGLLVVGNKLTASLGVWTPKPSGYKYQWTRNGKAIKGATKSSYTLAAADVGAVIAVVVTGSKATWSSASRASAPSVAVIKGTLSLSPVPTISGTAKKGKTLTVKPGKWAPTGVKLTYVWLRDGVPIAKATKSTYKLVAADVGGVITVQVTGSKAGYDTIVRVSAGTSAVFA